MSIVGTRRYASVDPTRAAVPEADARVFWTIVLNQIVTAAFEKILSLRAMCRDRIFCSWNIHFPQAPSYKVEGKSISKLQMDIELKQIRVLI
jgi:hypothetical protein